MAIIIETIFGWIEVYEIEHFIILSCRERK
jgi:hypothetical protein